jgi:hypothetical protein
MLSNKNIVPQVDEQEYLHLKKIFTRTASAEQDSLQE